MVTDSSTGLDLAALLNTTSLRNDLSKFFSNNSTSDTFELPEFFGVYLNRLRFELTFSYEHLEVDKSFPRNVGAALLNNRFQPFELDLCKIIPADYLFSYRPTGSMFCIKQCSHEDLDILWNVPPKALIWDVSRSVSARSVQPRNSLVDVSREEPRHPSLIISTQLSPSPIHADEPSPCTNAHVNSKECGCCNADAVFPPRPGEVYQFACPASTGSTQHPTSTGEPLAPELEDLD